MLFKRGVYGTFHHLSAEQLHRYLTEFDFRANTRMLNDERASALLRGTQGKRLMHHQPREASKT